MSSTRAALMITAILALASQATAVMLFTPPLAPGGTNKLKCRMCNVSDRDLVVEIVTFNKDGDAVRASGPLTLRARACDLNEALASENPRYCRFTVGGSSRGVRGSATINQVTEDGADMGVICAVAATDR